jgi:hypothetical protein
LDIIRQSTQSTFLLIVFSVLLSSCSSLDHTLDLVGLGPENLLTKITIESTPDSNSQYPVGVDLVFIFEETLATSLTNFTARQWFQKKAALRMQYTHLVKVVSTDVVPGSSAKSVKLPDNSKGAIAIMLFANYITKQGQLSTKLEGYKEVNIKLNRHKYLIKTSSN